MNLRFQVTSDQVLTVAQHCNYKLLKAAMKSLILTVLFLILPSAALAVSSGNHCCLCGYCANPLAARGNQHVTSTFTCNSLALAMANPAAVPYGSAACNNLIVGFRNKCCDPYTSFTAAAVAPAQSSAMVNPYPRGVSNACNLCANGQFPSKPYTLTAVLFLPGNPTCKDLYFMGLSGNIPNRLCTPIQDFMATPCGC